MFLELLTVHLIPPKHGPVQIFVPTHFAHSTSLTSPYGQFFWQSLEDVFLNQWFELHLFEVQVDSLDDRLEVLKQK